MLLHTDSEKFKLDVQARFEQVGKNIYGEVAATQLTSIAGCSPMILILKLYINVAHNSKENILIQRETIRLASLK